MCELTCHSYKIINYYGGVGIHAEYILNSCLTNMYIRYIYRRGRENLGQYKILDIVKLINTFLHI